MSIGMLLSHPSWEVEEEVDTAAEQVGRPDGTTVACCAKDRNTT